MKGFDMPFDHVTDAVLIAAMDDELPYEQSLAVERHVAGCEKCRARKQVFQALSADVEETASYGVSPADADSLAAAIDSRMRARAQTFLRNPRLRNPRWGFAIAATIALAVVLGPQMKRRSPQPITPAVSAAAIGTVEVDGETFISVPYSNPDIPTNGPHIVQMEVSVASLADAGILFGPIANQVSGGRDSVLADVLFGGDGQPLGVHVLDAE